MPRKSKSIERTAQILDAFGRCLIKYGLDTSLEQVAEEAGMTRSIIRHFIGNREEVINTLVDRIAKDYVRTLREESEKIPPDERVAATLDYLFAGEPEFEASEKLIMDVLMTAKDRYLTAKRTLITVLEGLVVEFAHDLATTYPKAPVGQCQEVAYSILAMAMSNESLSLAGIDRRYRAAARASAEALIRTLAALPLPTDPSRS